MGLTGKKTGRGKEMGENRKEIGKAKEKRRCMDREKSVRKREEERIKRSRLESKWAEGRREERRLKQQKSGKKQKRRKRSKKKKKTKTTAMNEQNKIRGLSSNEGKGESSYREDRESG